MMTDMIIVNRKALNRKKYSTFWCSFGAAFSLITGIISIIAALLLICISAVTGESFNGAEVVLIVASLALCFFGAHCLDISDKRRKLQKKEEIYFRHGDGNIH